MGMHTALKRFLYLTHRWVGIVLGLLVFAWFVSGIAMMYYPWPGPTAERAYDKRPAFVPDSTLVSPGAAWQVGTAFLAAHEGELHVPAGDVVAMRLQQWAGRPVFELQRQRGGHREGAVLVDAASGAVHFPVTSAEAELVAREVLPASGAAAQVDSLHVGDHYMMASEFEREYPAWRVQFGDGERTAAYVSRRTGRVFGIVTTRARVTTWIGTVPHWLYFQWLHDRRTLWTWSNYLLPAIACLIALTGIVLGVQQLYPRRARGDRRMSAYRGMSKWHHVSGVVFGVLVLTWTFTGVLEMLGPGLGPSRAQVDAVQGAPDPAAVAISPATAVATAGGGPVRAVDLLWSGGVPGYAVRRDEGTTWVDARTGASRAELSPDAATGLAMRILPGATVRDVARLDAYDTYYYAGHGRGVPLPVMRVSFADAAGTALYLDPLTGLPVGRVDASWRRWRWWRDALHTFDIPALNNRRPLWDIITLLPMLGGTLVSLTGAWLLARRLWRNMFATARASARGA